MRVSVIIPHYDMADFLPRAVRSVKAQGESVAEIMVVDDGTPDEDEWLRAIEGCGEFDFPDETWWRYEENKGQAHAVNDALESVLRHPIDAIAFLDADDEWMPSKLAAQLAVLEEEPSVAMVFGHARQVRWTTKGPEHVSVRPAPLLSSLLIRREAMELVGMFEEGLGAGTMIEWLSRAEKKFGLKKVMLDDVLYIRHVHGKNYGVVHHERAQSEYMAALHLVRERYG